MSIVDLLSTINRVSLQIWSRLWRFEARLKGFQFEGTSLFLGRPIMSRHPDSTVRIGSGVRCYNSARANLIACPQPSVLRTLSPGSRLVLGRNVGLSAAVVVAARSIEIGADTQIGSGAVVVDNDLHSRDAAGCWGELDPSEARPVKIGSRVFIGARAIILKGVTLGDDCIVGAGAVVTKSVPDGFLAAGNPAVARPLPRRVPWRENFHEVAAQWR
jgi:acetyltransferase-like isoleucine patch superfamily enzyme